MTSVPRARRVLEFWLVRLALALVFLVVAIGILREIPLSLLRRTMNLTETPTIWLGREGSPQLSMSVAVYALLAAVVTIACGWGAYWLYLRWIERRSALELARPGMFKELGQGLACGTLVIVATLSALWPLGYFSIAGAGSLLAFVVACSRAATAAFMEELVVRGVGFRILEDRFGSVVALAVTASLFGAAHLSNANSSWWAAIAIASTGGLVTGLAYILTRRLWLAIGLHFGVNLVPGGIFGLEVSGNAREGLLRSTLDGPELLTGGRFGLESSVLFTILGLTLAVILLRMAVRRGEIRPFRLRGGTS